MTLEELNAKADATLKQLGWQLAVRDIMKIASEELPLPQRFLDRLVEYNTRGLPRD